MSVSGSSSSSPSSDDTECVFTRRVDDGEVLSFELARRDEARFAIVMTLVLFNQGLAAKNEGSAQEIDASLSQ
jgi:hypothetical protein